MDSGLIDSHAALGINATSFEWVQYGKATTCKLFVSILVPGVCCSSVRSCVFGYTLQAILPYLLLIWRITDTNGFGWAPASYLNWTNTSAADHGNDAVPYAGLNLSGGLVVSYSGICLGTVGHALNFMCCFLSP